jgi:hypothetical protein
MLHLTCRIGAQGGDVIPSGIRVEGPKAGLGMQLCIFEEKTALSAGANRKFRK